MAKQEDTFRSDLESRQIAPDLMELLHDDRRTRPIAVIIEINKNLTVSNTFAQKDNTAHFALLSFLESVLSRSDKKPGDLLMDLLKTDKADLRKIEKLLAAEKRNKIQKCSRVSAYMIFAELDRATIDAISRLRSGSGSPIVYRIWLDRDVDAHNV